MERDRSLLRWQDRWRTTTTVAEWTRKLIPNVEEWYRRKHGETCYHLTEALTGHGAFNAYLYRMGKMESPRCDYCRHDDTAEHTLFYCRKWSTMRLGLYEETEGSREPADVVRRMLANKTSWNRISEILISIVKSKEEDQRRLQREEENRRRNEPRRRDMRPRRYRRGRVGNPFARD
jgi:hypothetical protein